MYHNLNILTGWSWISGMGIGLFLGLIFTSSFSSFSVIGLLSSWGGGYVVWPHARRLSGCSWASGGPSCTITEHEQHSTGSSTIGDSRGRLYKKGCSGPLASRDKRVIVSTTGGNINCGIPLGDFGANGKGGISTDNRRRNADLFAHFRESNHDPRGSACSTPSSLTQLATGLRDTNRLFSGLCHTDVPGHSRTRIVRGSPRRTPFSWKVSRKERMTLRVAARSQYVLFWVVAWSVSGIQTQVLPMIPTLERLLNMFSGKKGHHYPDTDCYHPYNTICYHYFGIALPIWQYDVAVLLKSSFMEVSLLCTVNTIPQKITKRYPRVFASTSEVWTDYCMW